MTETQQVRSSQVELRLTREDRTLILRYGYPFPKLAAELARVQERRGTAEILCDRFELEQLLGDLARSINECKDRGVLIKLDHLYVSIEWEAAR